MSDPYAAPQQPSADPDEIELTKDDLTSSMLCHLLALSGWVIPFGNFLGPIIIWMMKKDESEFVDYHGRESLNFQISLLIYSIPFGILIFVCVVSVVLIPLAILLGIGGFLFAVAFPIIAGVRGNSGEFYRYPLTIRFL